MPEISLTVAVILMASFVLGVCVLLTKNDEFMNDGEYTDSFLFNIMRPPAMLVEEAWITIKWVWNRIIGEPDGKQD